MKNDITHDIKFEHFILGLTLILPLLFVLKMLSAFYFCCYSSVLQIVRLDFFMEANNMNPDQTAPREQSDLYPYCLQYRLAKNIGRWEEQMT